MRLKINFSKNTEEVPHNLSVVNSYVHKCLGRNNEYHDSYSNYNISGLLGGEIINDGRNLQFNKGGYIIISSLDMEFLNKIIFGIISNTDFGYGMKFINLDYINENFYNGWNFFKTTNIGFILKRKDKKNNGYYTLNDENFTEILKNHIINKFSKIDSSLNFNDLEIVINNHESHKSKATYSKNIKNISNICQLNIFTNKKLAEMIYNYGIGESCGSGFGTIYTTHFNAHYNEYYK